MTVTVAGISAAGASTTGRNLDVWGARRVGLFRVTGDSSWLGTGEPFDPRLYGFDAPVAAVFISRRYAADPSDGSVQFLYDYTNKTIVAWDTTAGDNADADNFTTVVLDIIILGE